MEVSKTGYKKVVQKQVVVSSGKTTSYNITLESLKKPKQPNISEIESLIYQEQRMEFKAGKKDQFSKFIGSGYVGGVTAMSVADYPVHADFNTESYDRIQENSFKEVIHNPLSTFSIDVDRASYSNVRRFLNNHTLPYKDAVRIEEMINYFSYDYPQPEGDKPFS
ncbi:MAG: von Willebrand factor type A domain-containing protein, partial [Bacteroidia bacterium]|nr:von Willebrand factor type A domain-containing protein [Bacteroidia bacterium]